MKRSIFVAVAMAAALAQVSPVAAADCKKTYEWKLGFNTVQDSIRGAATAAMQKVVAEKSGGCAVIKVFPGETLGTEQEMIEAVQLGALDMTLSGGGALSNVDPLFGATTMPFLFSSFEQAQAVLNGPFGDRLKERALAKGLKVLTFSELGFAQITNSKKAINGADDLYGLKIRSPKEATLIATFESLGATVTPMPFSEVYLALSQGVVDGQFNPLDAIYENKFNEVQDYLALVNIFYYNTVLSMSKAVWDGVDADTQAILLEGAKAAQKAALDYANDKQNSMLAKMKSSFKEITQPDTVPFRGQDQGRLRRFPK